MALYQCGTDNPLNTNLIWEVTAWGTVCSSELNGIKINGKMSTVLRFKMIDDNGETHRCYVWGEKGVNLAPYVIKGRRVIVGGKASSESLHSITALSIRLE